MKVAYGLHDACRHLATKSFLQLFIQCCSVSLPRISVRLKADLSRDKGERENIFFNTSGSLAVESCFLRGRSVTGWFVPEHALDILSKKLMFSFSVTCSMFLHKDKVQISSPAKLIMERDISDTDVSLLGYAQGSHSAQ